MNIAQAARQNRNFRTALWTGEHFQVTLMSIPVGEDIGLEVTSTTDHSSGSKRGRGSCRWGPAGTDWRFSRWRTRGVRAS